MGSCSALAMASVVHSASDKNAAFPMEGKVEAADLIATFFHCPGYSPETEILDSLIPLSRGKVIQAIL